jgi:hypothetical protein
MVRLFSELMHYFVLYGVIVHSLCLFTLIAGWRRLTTTIHNPSSHPTATAPTALIVVVARVSMASIAHPVPPYDDHLIGMCINSFITIHNFSL